MVIVSLEAGLFSLSTLSLLLQFYVVYLVVFISPPEMSNYRFFLITFTTWDMLFTATLGYALQTESLFPLPGAIINGLFKYVGQVGATVGAFTMVFVSVNVFFAQAYCMAFRLFAVIENKSFFHWYTSNRGHVTLLVFGVLVGILLALPSVKSVAGKEEIPLIMAKYGSLVGPPPSDAVLLILDTENQWVRLSIAALSLAFIVSELSCILLGLLIFKTLRAKVKSYSKKTYQMHRQLTVLLVVQLATPFILLVLPYCVLLIGLLLKVNLRFIQDHAGVYVLTSYGMSNALLTILLVTPYRKHMMIRLSRDSGQSKTPVIVSGTA